MWSSGGPLSNLITFNGARPVAYWIYIPLQFAYGHVWWGGRHEEAMDRTGDTAAARGKMNVILNTFGE